MFRQCDVTRAVKALAGAGLEVVRVETIRFMLTALGRAVLGALLAGAGIELAPMN